MSIALYRKYRSQTFDEIIGQDHIMKLLKSSIKKHLVSHAYLFVGSRGTGKTSTARIFAKAVNCLEPTEEGNPCNTCKNCKAINQDKFMDLIEIDAASNRGIDKIRDLKEKLEFSPVEGKYKIYIIDEVHMLTKEAFNALLKTLEEPPKHVIFILATTEVHKLPSTILSRCQRYDFKLGTDIQIKKAIVKASKGESIELEDEALQLLVKSAQGSYRDGLSFLDIVVSGQTLDDSADGDAKKVTEEELRKILGLPEKLAIDQFLKSLIDGDESEAISLIKELSSRGVNFQQFVKEVLESLRTELVNNITSRGETNYDLNKKEILLLIKLFLQVDKDLYYSSVPSLPLEVAVAQSGDIFDEKEVAEEQEATEEEDTGEDMQEEDIESESDDDYNSTNDEVKESDDFATDISLKKIKNKWEDIRVCIKKENKHLYAILRGAKLNTVEDGILKINVSYEYHKETLESVKSRTAMQAACKKVFGSPVHYECVIKKSKIKKARKKNPLDLGIVQKVKKKVQTSQSKEKDDASTIKKAQVEEIFADL